MTIVYFNIHNPLRKAENLIPAPLVSTSLSLGNTITGNFFSFPSWATTTGSAPWVMTAVLLRISDALGHWESFRAISSTSSVWLMQTAQKGYHWKHTQISEILIESHCYLPALDFWKGSCFCLISKDVIHIPESINP